MLSGGVTVTPSFISVQNHPGVPSLDTFPVELLVGHIGACVTVTGH